MSSASTNFNPYLKWLGIRCDAPNHYQLLGIETFESDADVIVAAADRQMAHVRKYQNGPHSADSQALLNELAAAKVCLLNAEKKAAYDVQLAAVDMETATASLPGNSHGWLLGLLSIVGGVSLTAALLVMWLLRPNLVPSLPGASAPATLTDNGKANLSNSSSNDAVVHAESSTDEGFGAQMIGASAEPTPFSAATPASSEPGEGPLQLVAGGPADMPASERPQVPPPDGQQATQTATSATGSRQDQDTDRVGETSTSAPLVKVVDVGPAEAKPTAPPTPPNQSPPWEKSAQKRRLPQRPFADQQTAIARLLQSLYDRNIEAAEALLEQVRAEAVDQPKRDEALRIEIIYFKMKEFWDKADQGLKVVAVGDTLNYRGGAVTLVAKNPSTVRLQAVNGEARDFDVDRAKIDADVAVALARANGEASGIMLDVICGVFLAIDRQGDLNAARDLLKRARENGVPVELLLAARPSARRDLSQDSQDAAAADPLLAAIFPVDRGDDADPGAGIGHERKPAPTLQARRESLRMLREVYHDQFAKRGFEAELQLANRLFQDANRSRDDADARYVMYEQAIRLASKQGDAKLADAATRALVYNFACDEDAIRLETLAELCKKLRDAEQARVAVDAVSSRLHQLMEADDFSTARKYLPAATTAATRSKLPESARNASGLEQLLSDLEDHLRDVRHELMGSAAIPDDATVHTILGLYELHKGRDEEAQRHLQVCSHAGLARASAAEQDMDGSAESQLAVADLWWHVSAEDQSHGVLSQLARQKAIHWYTQALDRLEGVSKLRAATRIRS